MLNQRLSYTLIWMVFLLILWPPCGANEPALPRKLPFDKSS